MGPTHTRGEPLLCFVEGSWGREGRGRGKGRRGEGEEEGEGEGQEGAYFVQDALPHALYIHAMLKLPLSIN